MFEPLAGLSVLVGVEDSVLISVSGADDDAVLVVRLLLLVDLVLLDEVLPVVLVSACSPSLVRVPVEAVSGCVVSPLLLAVVS